MVRDLQDCTINLSSNYIFKQQKNSLTWITTLSSNTDNRHVYQTCSKTNKLKIDINRSTSILSCNFLIKTLDLIVWLQSSLNAYMTISCNLQGNNWLCVLYFLSTLWREPIIKGSRRTPTPGSHHNRLKKSHYKETSSKNEMTWS